MFETAGSILLAAAASYVAGSIPTGYWLGQLRGVDIRTQGSGNVGATNVLRVLGTPAGLLVLLIDFLKGFAAVAWLPRLTPYPALDFIRVACGLSAVLGHTYTMFLGFKGGKGVATSTGVFLALAPLSTALALMVFVGVVASTRYVSLGSSVCAILLPLLIWLTGESGRGFSILALAVVLAAGILWLHRGNLARLREGTENRLGRPAPPAPQP